MAEPIKINEDTWRIEDGMVRFFVLEGKEKALMIDTGMQCPNAKEIGQSVTKLPLILLNTHTDPDHISGNGGFETAYMSEKELDHYKQQGKGEAIIPVKEGDRIDLGDRVLEIIDIPGHTPGSIAILDEKYRVLYIGDTVQDGMIYMMSERRNMPAYIESLKHLSKYEDRYDCLYPSHGTIPVTKDLIPKLMDGATKILEGKATGVPTDFFTGKIMVYKFDYAGFLCDLPK